MGQNGSLPQGSGWTWKKYLSCHHLVFSFEKKKNLSFPNSWSSRDHWRSSPCHAADVVGGPATLGPSTWGGSCCWLMMLGCFLASVGKMIQDTRVLGWFLECFFGWMITPSGQEFCGWRGGFCEISGGTSLEEKVDPLRILIGVDVNVLLQFRKWPTDIKQSHLGLFKKKHQSCLCRCFVDKVLRSSFGIKKNLFSNQKKGEIFSWATKKRTSYFLFEGSLEV